MADLRILRIPVPVGADTTAFQLGFSPDLFTWKTLKVASATDQPVADIGDDGFWTADAVNAAADASATSNLQAASVPPMFYRLRLKAGSDYGEWLDPFVIPSLDDFVAGMKDKLKDPSINPDPGPPLLTDRAYMQCVANAVEAFERHYPLLASQTYTLSPAYDYPLPTRWERSFSAFVQAEYPTGATPRQFIPADWVVPDEQTGNLRLINIRPVTGESMQVYFQARHGRDGRTVPPTYFNSVLMWACGDAAQKIRASSNQFGNVMINADYVAIDPRIREWAKIAMEWKEQAVHIWGSADTGARTHLPSYDTHGRVPAAVWAGIR